MEHYSQLIVCTIHKVVLSLTKGLIPFRELVKWSISHVNVENLQLEIKNIAAFIAYAAYLENQGCVQVACNAVVLVFSSLFLLPQPIAVAFEQL
jgi:hypothetical protein